MAWFEERVAKFDSLEDELYILLDAAKNPVLLADLRAAVTEDQLKLINLSAVHPQDDAAFRRAYLLHHTRMRAFAEVLGYLEAVQKEIQSRQSESGGVNHVAV